MIRRDRNCLLLIISFSVLLRLAVALYLGDTVDNAIAGTFDQHSYDMLAQRVATGHGFSFATYSWPDAKPDQPTAFWSYAYTLYLAGVYTLFGHHPLVARLIQAVLTGVAMPVLFYRIGRRSFNTQIGLIAAGLSAGYLYFVIFDAALMTEAFYIITILWVFDISQRMIGYWFDQQPAPYKVGLELGIAIGLSILLRQVILFFYLVLAVWLLYLAWRTQKMKNYLYSGVLTSIIVILLLAPWMVRNYTVFGRISMPNTNSGFAFFWSNHPIYGTQFETVLSPDKGVSYQELLPTELATLNESEKDNELLKRGIGFVQADPMRFVKLSLSRIPVQFQFWPSSRSSTFTNFARLFSFGLLLPLAGLGLLFLGRQWQALQTNMPRQQQMRQKMEWLLLALFFVIYNGLHIISWAKVRYRLPTDIVLIWLAAYMVASIHKGWQRNSANTHPN